MKVRQVSTCFQEMAEMFVTLVCAVFQHNLYGYIFKEFAGVIDF
jgi:hypothetical protein